MDHQSSHIAPIRAQMRPKAAKSYFKLELNMQPLVYG